MVRDVRVVQVRHLEVRVHAHTDLRQMHDGDIAAVAIHDVLPLPRDREKDPPLILAGFVLGCSGMLSP